VAIIASFFLFYRLQKRNIIVLLRNFSGLMQEDEVKACFETSELRLIY
jgi:hypothetical protein